MSDYVYPLQPSSRSTKKATPATVSPQGSLYINNTSYSGVDIKILLNVYDQAGEMAGVEGSVEFARMGDKHTSLKEELAAADNKLSNRTSGPYRVGTRGRKKLQTQRNRIAKDYKEMGEHIQRSVGTVEKYGPSATGNKVLAECQTLSLTTFRDKQSVRACGSVGNKGVTRGPREIGGSMIFTVFDEHVLYSFLTSAGYDFSMNDWGAAILDQIPPVDLTILCANEYGFTSRMALYGVDFHSEGMVMSVEDLITESNVSFIARDVDPLRAVKNRKIDRNNLLLSEWGSTSASSLIRENDVWKNKDRWNPFARFQRRRSPYS
jgi:hypothetical protein